MKFPLGDVLSITTGRLVSPTGMDGVYQILNHLTGDNLFTHQLPRACTWAAPLLTAAHPELGAEALADHLADLTRRLDAFPEQDVAVVFNWVDSIRLLVGYDHLDLSPLPGWQGMDPIAELVAMRSRVDA